MALTKDFQDTVRARAQRDPRFRRALLAQAITTLLSGDVDTGKAVLRDYINATVGFRLLAETTGIPAKSLMRMFGRVGNPSASNVFAVLANLQALEGVDFELKAKRRRIAISSRDLNPKIRRALRELEGGKDSPSDGVSADLAKLKARAVCDV
jgi:hypothetical protein